MDASDTQAPAGSDSNGGARPPQHGTAELAAKERSDPNQTGGPEDGEPESGAGYGNHATGYEDEADD